MENRFVKLNKKYNINIIGEDQYSFIYELDGYTHCVSKSSISRCNLHNVSTMIGPSYMKYVNNVLFSNTPLECIDYNDKILTILNTDTNQFIQVIRGQFNVDSLLNMTTKQNKYREKIIKILGENYEYDKCWPTSIKDKVTIRCKLHGEYTTSADNIIHHHCICPECANESKGYSRHTFIKSCMKNNNSTGTLYVIRIYSEDEDFIKVGITSYNDIYHRVRELKTIGYNIDTIELFHNIPSKIYNAEKFVHKQMWNEKYMPKHDFNGRLECYETKNLNKIMNFICKKLKV